METEREAPAAGKDVRVWNDVLPATEAQQPSQASGWDGAPQIETGGKSGWEEAGPTSRVDLGGWDAVRDSNNDASEETRASGREAGGFNRPAAEPQSSGWDALQTKPKSSGWEEGGPAIGVNLGRRGHLQPEAKSQGGRDTSGLPTEDDQGGWGTAGLSNGQQPAGAFNSWGRAQVGISNLAMTTAVGRSET